MNQEEQQFIKGFNNGYILQKYEPDLLSQLIHTLLPSNWYLEGFFAGKEEYELEQSQKELDDLHRLRDQTRGQEHDLEHDV
jgi:hypothetical protein